MIYEEEEQEQEQEQEQEEQEQEQEEIVDEGDEFPAVNEDVEMDNLVDGDQNEVEMGMEIDEEEEEPGDQQDSSSDGSGTHWQKKKKKKVKNWNFIKIHSHVHAADDIRAKGVTRNYNTKPNENSHGRLKKAYQRTNFKNIEEQVSLIYLFQLLANTRLTDGKDRPSISMRRGYPRMDRCLG